MHAYAKRGQGSRDIYAVVKSRAIGEQGSTSDDAVAMSFGNPAVYAGCPTQIIRINDEIFHTDCTFFVGLPVLSYSYSVFRCTRFVPLTDTDTNSSMATSEEKLRPNAAQD